MFEFYTFSSNFISRYIHLVRFCLVCLVSSPIFIFAQSNSNAGLWIGEALVSRVAEVAVPLDENNVPRAPDPNVPTLTHDLASLRLIIHVDALGDVRFLKDVAILKSSRVSGNAVLDQDIALITDPSLYSNFSGQPGHRFATAAFDFGDQKTTAVLNKLMDDAVNAAVNQAMDRAVANVDLEDKAKQEALTAANIVLDDADLNKAFNNHVSYNISSSELDLKLTNSQLFPAPILTQLNSPYSDSRTSEMVDALNLIINDASLSSDQKKKKLNNTAASFVDSQYEYNRFLEGAYFSQMISAAANSAATQRIENNANTASQILNSFDDVTVINDAKEEAKKIKLSRFGYSDSRGEDAIDEVLNYIADNAISSASTTVEGMKNELILEGVKALENNVLRYPSPSTSPTSSYNSFIESSEFTDAPKKASIAASKAVYEERQESFPTQTSYTNAAKIAVANDLQTAFSAAARANVSELLMTAADTVASGFAPSNSVSVTINLPAMHPTNPFRHRRNPDHVKGFDITRIVTLTIETNANNKLNGIYEEEIKGLHKPLGPNKDIGLKVKGKFELNRVSKVATLNGN